MILSLVLLTNLFCDEFSKIMTDRCEMSMIEVLTFFLGFQIKQVKDGTFISQMKYTRDILTKFGMDKAKPIKTSMDTNGHIDLYMGSTSVDQKVYRSMFRSFLYLCAYRPDIMLSVCMCVRFQAAPKDYHLRTVKRIMRYLVLTPNLGDEDMPIMDTTTSSWSDTKIFLNTVNSFLRSSTNYFENRLLPNDLIIVRNHGDDDEDEWDIKRALERQEDEHIKVEILTLVKKAPNRRS
jgi:hypothetical protein